MPERLTARGGASVPPVAVAADTPTLILVPPGSTGDQSVMRRRAFGRRLVTARERSGVTIEEISKTTKIGTSLLTALEEGDASRWPKGIFRRAFFRDYVVAIGLPTEPLVAEFLQLFPDGEVHPTAAASSPAPTAGDLRLMLDAVPRWHQAPARITRELLLFAPVAALAAGVVIWSDAPPWTAAGLVGLCYYQRLMGAVRTLASRRHTRSQSR